MSRTRAKKSFGQHFLHQKGIAQRIARSLQLASAGYEHVLEVGPGKGMLTQYLLDQEYHLKVVEADRDMVAHLAEHLPALLQEDVIYLDFLKVRPDRVFDGQPFGLIGNFPYNISSQIVFKMLDYHDLIPEMVGMFQKEMAERIVAPEGGKDYGVISVLAQAYYRGEMLFDVKPSNFTPPPKVQSAVIRLTRREEQPDVPFKVLRRTVKMAFAQRRKMLRNTLKTCLPAERLQDDYFKQRAEKLTVAEFIALAKEVKAFDDCPPEQE